MIQVTYPGKVGMISLSSEQIYERAGMRKEYGNDIFYHYTDFQALDGILHYTQLRVNNVLNMNDAAEMRHFMSRMCSAVVKKLLQDGEK